MKIKAVSTMQIDRLRIVLKAHSLTMVAMVLSVGGWAMIWAQALSIVHLFPMWVAVGAFYAGLAMIPFLGLRCGNEEVAKPISANAAKTVRPYCMMDRAPTEQIVIGRAIEQSQEPTNEQDILLSTGAIRVPGR